MDKEYYERISNAEVMERTSKNTLIDPTGVIQYLPHLSSTRSPLANCLDNSVIESLEGYVLPLLRITTSYIHNLHFKTKITPECYAEHDIQELPDISWNKGKQLFEIIGNARVTYTFYPGRTVNIEVKCSNTNPFKLETEIDRSHILVFFGQLRDRLIAFLNDPHERIVSRHNGMVPNRM